MVVVVARQHLSVVPGLGVVAIPNGGEGLECVGLGSVEGFEEWMIERPAPLLAPVLADVQRHGQQGFLQVAPGTPGVPLGGIRSLQPTPKRPRPTLARIFAKFRGGGKEKSTAEAVQN